MSLRITYLINLYPKVSHSFIRREILALERRGHKVQRIAMRGWNAELVDVEDERERGCTRYVLNDGFIPLLWSVLRILLAAPLRFGVALALAFRMGRGGQRSLPYHLMYFAEACRILPWIESFGATHIHAHFGANSAETAMLASALGGPPYSFTVHGQDELFFGGTDEKVRRATFAVAISSFGRGLLYLRLPRDLWPKVKVVRCGLEAEHYSNVENRPPTVRRLVCVGRLCAEKGQLLLVEAAHCLARKGIDFELVLAGDGEMRNDVEKLIEEYRLSKCVRITGWVSSRQVRDEILAARALVLPSFTEGLPVVIMEALGLGRPVLATYVGGIPELVIPGESGWLFPAGDVKELAAAMEDCLTRPVEQLRAMGEAGRRRVAERHSIDTETAKLAELFRYQSP